MKTMFKSLCAAVLAATLILTPAYAQKEKSSSSSSKSSTSAEKAKRYPIHGKIVAVDKSANTFTLKGAKGDRVIKVNSDTKITSHGKPATLDAAVVGQDAGGYVEKQSDGSVLALSARFGSKEANEPAGAQTPKKYKKY